MNQQKDPPIKKFRAKGGLLFAIWSNDEKQQDGTIRRRFSGRLQKRYKDKKNNWHDSDYLFPEDWPKVELLMRKASEYAILTESEVGGADVPI